MPVTLNQITNNQASVSTVYGDDSVNIVYYPARVTEKTFAQLQSFDGSDIPSMQHSFESFNELISSLISSWDVYEDDAQTIQFPTTPDRLSELPIAFRLQVIRAILGDIRPEAMMPKTPN